MNKIFIGIICLILITSFSSAPLKASANTTVENEAQINLLMQIIVLLQAQLTALLQEKNPGNTVSYTNIDKDIFRTIVKGTPLENHILVAGEYTFTDGKEGVDTVIYKNNKSEYRLYKGNPVPEKGYLNPIIVVGVKVNFIEIDVNSEYVQFKDQLLTIPDLKKVDEQTVAK